MTKNLKENVNVSQYHQVNSIRGFHAIQICILPCNFVVLHGPCTIVHRYFNVRNILSSIYARGVPCEACVSSIQVRET